jgi:hypothetical protein
LNIKFNYSNEKNNYCSFFIIFSNQTYSTKLDDIQTRLDDIEWEQMMRDNERQFEQDMRDIQRLKGQKNDDGTLRSEIRNNPNSYKFIGKFSSFKIYVSLPISRVSKDWVNLVLNGLSDEIVTDDNGNGFSTIVVGLSLRCYNKTSDSRISTFTFEGKRVGYVEERNRKYDSKNPLYLKLDKDYCH